MTVIKRFEDLIAWQEARKLSKAIYALTRQSPLRKDFAHCDQLRRAALSAMTNIAEGFDCQLRVEFARFLVIVRRSTVDVQSHLCSALDDGDIACDNGQAHYDHAARVKHRINRLKYSMSTSKTPTPSDTSRHLETC
jgi:four helix bundle protein